MKKLIMRNLIAATAVGLACAPDFAAGIETIAADLLRAARESNPKAVEPVASIAGAFSAPMELHERGVYRVWVNLWTPANKRANAALKIDAPTGESVWYERMDYLHGLPKAKPYENRVLTRAEGDFWHSFDLNVEYPGTYCFNLVPVAGSVGGVNLLTKGIWASSDPSFDPKRTPRATPATARETPSPAGFIPAAEMDLHASLNTGIDEVSRRFKATVHQNYPVYFADGMLVNLGYTFNQMTYGRKDGKAAKFGLPGATPLSNGPKGDIWKQYPMTKKDETAKPVGRMANVEGSYWDAWSYSFAPANASAYEADLQTVKEVVEGPFNEETESWYIAWENGGTYDYGETSVKAFQAWLGDKYGSIESLNKAWHTSFTSFQSVVPANRDDCVGAKKIADPFVRAQHTANFIDFREFCSKEYAKIVARRAKAARTDPQGRPVSTQFANLDLNAVEWSGWRPLDMEDLMRIGFKDIDSFGYDVYAVDDWVGAEFDTLSAFGYDRKPIQMREGSTHTPDPVLAVRSFWTLVGKGVKGLSSFMLQEGNNNAEFPKFGLTNFDQSPRPKLAAYSDAVRAIHQIERQLMASRRVHADKPVAIYYSRTCNALQERSYGSLFDSGPDSPFRVYELIRGNGFPVTFITDAQIRDKKRLGDVAAVFLVDAKYIPADVVGALDAWVAEGGHVFADAQPGIYDGHGFPQDAMIKLLGIDPVEAKRVDRMAADRNAFGYSAVSFDVVDSDRLHRTQFEFFQQWDSEHPISRRLGKFMFSGFGYQQINCTDGEVVAMAHGGRPAATIREHGKGTFTYFAGYLGTIFGGAATQYEWRDAHSEDSPYRFIDAYLAFIGAKPVAETNLRWPRRMKMRLEAPLVDDRGNAILSMTNYSFEDSGTFKVAYALPPEIKSPQCVLAITSGSREVQALPFELEGRVLHFTMPSFLAYGAVLVLNDSEPIISIECPAAKRAEAGLIALHPNQIFETKVRIFNTTSRPLDAGTVTLRLPRGWYYDRAQAQVPVLKPGEASEAVAFRIHTPPVCARDNVRPLNFIYESGDGVKSMPTVETVWWRK